MKRLHLTIITTIGLLFTAVSANAQFDPNKTTTTLDSKIDTLKVKTKKASEKLDFKIYNDAYDKYLRELQQKFRNRVVVNSGLTINQTTFTNWAQGGVNSFSGRSFVIAEHWYTTPSFSIYNKFDAAIGMISADSKWRKSEDRFEFISKPGWKISPRWDFSAEFKLRSQFANTFDTKKNAEGNEYALLKSTIFAPAYLSGAPGFTYRNKPKTIEAFFSPVGGQFVMVLNKDLADRGSFGPAGRQFIPQFVNRFYFIYRENLYKDKLSIYTKLESVWDYNHKTPRLDWENRIGYKLTKVLSANIYTRTIYDDVVKTPDESNHWQFTETFGISVGYRFESKKHPAPPQAPRKNFKRIGK